MGDSMAEYQHESYWPKFKELAEAGNHKEIENEISALKDQKEQVALLRFTVRGMMFRDWKNKSLQPVIRFGDLAIATAIKIGEIDEANIICYNMSANLAGCWNDGFHRSHEHFKKGLQYAERALKFRHQLKKGPIPFSMAYWAKGAHLFFLSDYEAAEENFNLSLKSAIEAAATANQSTEINKDAPFYVLIAYGYIALAQIAAGRSEGNRTFDQVITSFEEMKGISEDAKADAEIGLDQLRYVQTKYELDSLGR